MNRENRHKARPNLLYAAYIQANASKVGKFLINFFKVIEDTLEKLHTKSRILSSGRGPNTVHAKLYNTTVDGSHTNLGTGHRTNGATAARVISDLEKLQL